MSAPSPSLPLYTIAQWHSRFENNRTRELKRLDWVPIPNQLDGDAYTLIMAHEHGAAIYGAWIACVKVASRCDPRGTLLREGGKPHDSATLSRITRVPEPIVQEMLQLLSSPDVGWLEVKHLQRECGNPAPSCEIPAEGCLEGKGMEGNGIEEKEKNTLHRESQFTLEAKPEKPADRESEIEGIYQEFPKKVGKPEALKAIRKAITKIAPHELLRRTKAFGDLWQGAKDYCPHPATWFNQERYNDDPSTWGPRGSEHQQDRRTFLEHEIKRLRDELHYEHDRTMRPNDVKLLADYQAELASLRNGKGATV